MSQIRWEKFWATHNSLLVIAAIFLFLLSGLFLFYAIDYDRYASTLSSQYENAVNASRTQINAIDDLMEKEELSKLQSGEVYFEMPNIINPNSFWDVKVSCVLFIESGHLSQTSLVSNISVSLEFGPTFWSTFEIYYIEVEPVNVINVYEHWDYQTGWSYEGFSPSSITLWQEDNIGAAQIWSGLDWSASLFQNAGPVELIITIDGYPQNDFLNVVDQETYLSNYVPNFNTTVELPSLYVESAQSVQQREMQEYERLQTAILQSLNISQSLTGIQQNIYEHRNRSLTYFVLFFASIDIGVIVYDHSEDEEKKAEYEKKRAEEDFRKKIQNGEYIV